MLSAVKTLKLLVLCFFIWFGMLLLAIVGAFLDVKLLAFIAAGGLLGIKLVGGALLVWWIANIAFALAEWTDKRTNNGNGWD